MTGDLISRSELLDSIRNFYKKQTAISQAVSSTLVSEIEKMIEEQPVAYDTDKIISEMKETISGAIQYKHKFCESVDEERCFQYEFCEECVAERMIEIVKSGGIGT